MIGDGGAAAPDPKSKQDAPIQLGTSGGWADDLANGYCCGGTLGGLVEDANGQYILSNFHVLAADRTSGGNGDTADLGDAVIQPGLIDVACNQNNAQVVATLDGWGDPLSGANIDAAIARVAAGMVDSTGAILGIGTLSSQTVAASVLQRVKKMGRTTGLSSSSIDGLNATISIQYEDECAGQSRGVATFTGQIVIANKGSKFLNSGDSGSLMVEDVSVNPRAVGLLYAGSSRSAIANPIDDVLSAFGVTMVGVAGARAADEAAADDDFVAAANAQTANAKAFEAAPNAIGHAISKNAAGKTILKVYVEKDAAQARAALPNAAGGFPVVVEEIGRVVAF
ncbi:MAG: hypothetical protein O2923_07240 [Verrucomicrobia bacterium]|nr:hypothetical protein [Verrucomicrobiota bacterium]MDA1087686.1 hypothetical protein [Verrucomicrobiota bacterium]